VATARSRTALFSGLRFIVVVVLTMPRSKTCSVSVVIRKPGGLNSPRYSSAQR
jgi:hypothetical protein